MTDRALTRRALLGAALPFIASSLLPQRVAGIRRFVHRDVLRVGALLPRADAGAGSVESLADLVSDGLTLGTEEAVRTAALFDLDVDVRRRHVGSERDVERASRELLGEGVTVVVSALAAGECASIRSIAADASVFVLTVKCTPDVAPPDGSCRPFTAHLSPSEPTIQRARAAFAGRRRRAESPTTAIVLWHHTLRRFGAEQLNERFRRRFAREMTSPAWAAWAAMKILTEGALRGRSTRGADVARYLASSVARFDGHKGEPLGFDPRTGELRQPLYVISATGSSGAVVDTLSIDDAYGPPGARPDAPPCPARSNTSR